jgi:hypothetical protein
MTRLVPFDALPWAASPQSGVERKMLERDGGEIARATSIVRYAPGSTFPAHVHDRGEEFLVLSGTFSDEHGDYAEGTYVRNPPDSKHAPFSHGGCIIFVKLRQFDMRDDRHIVLRPPHDSPTLSAFGNEHVRLLRLSAGGSLLVRGPLELLVIEGSVDHAAGRCERWSWLKTNTSDHTMHAAAGALVLVRTRLDI